MWIINFFICTVLYMRILYLWSRRQLDECLSLILFGYFCCPIFKVGSLEVNGSYFITLILFPFCAGCFQRGTMRINRDRFLLFQFGVISLMLMAGALNGKLDTSIIVPLIGNLNIAAGMFGCIVLFRKVDNPLLVLRQAIIKANILHVLFGVLQLTNVSAAYRITKQLYATASRSIPLDTMNDLGAFARVFGATFTPTLLGGYALLSFSFVFALTLIDRGKRKSNFLLLLSTILLGFMAFSRTAIMGMPIIGGIYLIWILFHGGKQYRKFFGKIISLLLIAFGFTILLAGYFGLLGQVQYYFGQMLRNPLKAFQGRYGNSVSMWGDSSATSGIAGTVAMFTKHPIIGVGMVAVADEFIEDSQYISLLHNGGLILFTITLLFYGSLYMKQRKTRGLPQMMILSSLMLAGLAINVLTVTSFIPFIALCVGLVGSRSDKYTCRDIVKCQYKMNGGGLRQLGKRRQEI